MLLGVQVISSLTLVPDQWVRVIGVELLVTGSVVWTATTLLSTRSARATEAPYRRGAVILLALRQLATIPLIIGRFLLLTVAKTASTGRFRRSP